MNAALAIATQRGAPSGGAEELSPLLFAAAEERGRWRYRPVAPAGATEGRDRHRQALARFLFPTELGDQSRDWPPELVQATVDLLALLARTFRATFTAHGRVAPTARSPSDAQLALHGFLSVAARGRRRARRLRRRRPPLARRDARRDQGLHALRAARAAEALLTSILRRPMSDLQDRTRWEPAEAEARIFARWLESGLFHPAPEGTAAENYSIAVPPPNVTGALHMGHALNGSVQDCLIRYHRMLGRRAKWIMGTDHAGIATQRQVEKLLESEGTSREALGREAFIERVWRWREEYGGIIFGQFQRLGASMDYEEERFTLDESYVRAVLKVFVTLHEKGLIYRDNYMVNWDPGPALGDLRPRGRGPRGHRHALLRRLPARLVRRLGHRRHRPAGDDPRRHRDRGPSGRRALHAARGGDGDPADRRPPADDHRRPVREAGVRHRRAEDHARPRPERLRDRPRARARRARGDRRGRPHERRRRRRPSRASPRSRRARRSWPRCARRARSAAPSRTRTRSRSRTARASASSR